MKMNTPGGIIDDFDRQVLVVQTREIYESLKLLQAYPDTESAFSFGQEIHVYADHDIESKQIQTYLEEGGIRDVHVAVGTPNIEDCFMDLMVRKAQIS